MQHRINGLPVVRQQSDKRDHYFGASTASLPKIVSADYGLYIFDQGQTETCAENAGAGARMFMIGKGAPVLSRAFLVAEVGAMERDKPETQGTKTIRDVCKVLMKQGVCLEAEYPFTHASMNGLPSSAVVALAKLRAIKGYELCEGLATIKAAIAAGRPVIAGIDCFAEIQSAAVARTGVIPMPKRGEQPNGGHGIYFRAYDDNKQLVGFPNSWSDKWGDRGWAWLPYDYFAAHVFDAWSLF